MKKIVKKMAATAFSLVGIFSAAPSVFCAPYGENESAQNIGIKYGDVCSSAIIEENSKEQLPIFSQMGVFLAGKRKYGNFVSTFPEGVRKLFYLPGSFNEYDFVKVMQKNKITNCRGKSTGKWERKLEINGNPMYGCCVVFTYKGEESAYKGKEIVFTFHLGADESLNSIEKYNKFMKRCGLNKAVITLPSEISDL